MAYKITAYYIAAFGRKNSVEIFVNFIWNHGTFRRVATAKSHRLWQAEHSYGVYVHMENALKNRMQILFLRMNNYLWSIHDRTVWDCSNVENDYIQSVTI